MLRHCSQVAFEEFGGFVLFRLSGSVERNIIIAEARSEIVVTSDG